jgi:hypothetical protein
MILVVKRDGGPSFAACAPGSVGGWTALDGRTWRYPSSVVRYRALKILANRPRCIRVVRRMAPVVSSSLGHKRSNYQSHTNGAERRVNATVEGNQDPEHHQKDDEQTQVANRQPRFTSGDDQLVVFGDHLVIVTPIPPPHEDRSSPRPKGCLTTACRDWRRIDEVGEHSAER